MPIWILNQQSSLEVNVTGLEFFLMRCLKQLRMPKAELSVVLMNDVAIQTLNRIHRHQNRPTDVLSFGMRELRELSDPLPPHPEVLGDLAVSVETVAKQAKARKISVQSELEFICAHGLLHLIGYDHMDRTQELRMNTLHTSLVAVGRGR